MELQLSYPQLRQDVMVHCKYLGITGYNFTRNITLLEITLVFTVCLSTHLGVSSIQCLYIHCYAIYIHQI